MRFLPDFFFLFFFWEGRLTLLRSGGERLTGRLRVGGERCITLDCVAESFYSCYDESCGMEELVMIVEDIGDEYV